MKEIGRLETAARRVSVIEIHGMEEYMGYPRPSQWPSQQKAVRKCKEKKCCLPDVLSENETQQKIAGKAIVFLALTYRTLVAQRLRGIGLYPSQELILMELLRQDCQSENALTRALFVDHSTIVKSVNRMQKTGLLTKNRSDNDKRVTIISLTPFGKELAIQSSAIWRETEEILCETLSAEEKECFIVLARRMAATLQKLLYPQPTDRN